MAQKKTKEPAEEKVTSSQQEEEKVETPSQLEEDETPTSSEPEAFSSSPAQDKQPVACFFTADGIRVNSENQPIDEYGTILDEKPLLRG